MSSGLTTSEASLASISQLLEKMAGESQTHYMQHLYSIDHDKTFQSPTEEVPNIHPKDSSTLTGNISYSYVFCTYCLKYLDCIKCYLAFKWFVYLISMFKKRPWHNYSAMGSDCNLHESDHIIEKMYRHWETSTFSLPN